MPYTPIATFEDIDITKHAIIEASAGTGKTYTIENLVIKLLKEREDLNLENILLVTFTEKATCELKLRICEKLESQLNIISDGYLLDKIKTTLDTFDSASIYTIHGFCQSVLRDYAFENKAPFRWEVIDDCSLFETLLKEQIRKTWPSKFGKDLPDILLLSDFTKDKSKLESLLIEASRTFHQNTNDRFLPDVRHLAFEEIAEKVRRIRGLILDLKYLSDQNPFCYGFENLNIQKPQKKILSEKIITPLGKYLSEIDSDQFSLVPLLDIISAIDDKGPEYLNIKYLKKDTPNPEACLHWPRVSENLSKIYELYLLVRGGLQAMAVLQLQKDVQAEKLKNGWISFDDMVGHVQKAVSSTQGSPLADILRQKYKVAFVDEFQDTDPVQWQIFKNIFLQESNDTHHNLLFLIGDPKQAIYGFRGADVYAYLDARQEMESLEEKGVANCYCLMTNWRSTSDLIRIFNQLFNTPEWFDPPEYRRKFDIAYIPVEAPPEDKRIFSIKKDHSERGFLNIFDLSGSPSLKASKPLLAKCIADEIQHLMSSDTIIRYDRTNDRTESISYGDFCVLVRGKNDMPFLEEQFNRKNIPYSYYKKPGLFSSREAFYLSLVLHAINEPGNLANFNKALLTPFFDITAENLYSAETIAFEHPIKRLLFQWHEWAVTRKWSFLFQSLMEDSGLIFRESSKPDWERKITNYHQIIEHLQEKAYHQNLDLRGLTALLDGYRNGTTDVTEDADLHQIETEALKVQIMTMHVAKGLEFPVVFVFGGLTQPSKTGTGFYVFHKICGKPPAAVKIFDLSKSTLGKEEYRKEMESEDKRLYYVALTRAQLKLYVPFFEFNKNYSWVGPVSRLLSPALINAFRNLSKAVDHVQWLKPLSSDFGKSFDPDSEKLLKSDAIVRRYNEAVIDEPFFPQPGIFSDRIIKMASFSSLHQMASGKKEPHDVSYGFSPMPKKAKDDDEAFVASHIPFADKPSDPNDIPGGTETGSMFHDILENISFETVLNAASKPRDINHPLLMIPETRDLIETQMEIYQIDRRWIVPVCDIILNTLTTPIFHLSDTFMLGELKQQDRIHEAEFYFPYCLQDKNPVPECNMSGGFIRGFIDMIFTYNKKFYIADWKSNIIKEGYEQSFLENNMTRAGYHLQYKIYTVAVLRWLRNQESMGFEPEKQFGGIFYFYIRGMNPQNNNGIYYISPSKIGPLELIEKDLVKI